MNLQQLNSPLPKPWLDINCNSINVEAKIDSFEVDAITLQTDTLLLNQNVAVGVPPVGYSLLYADNTDRLNVASQAQPTQQIAYLSDITLSSSKIIAPDGGSFIECLNDNAILGGYTSGGLLLKAKKDSGITTIFSPDAQASLSLNDNTGVSLKSHTGDIELQPENHHNVFISGYSMPRSIGPNRYVLTSDGSNVVWRRVEDCFGALVIDD